MICLVSSLSDLDSMRCVIFLFDADFRAVCSSVDLGSILVMAVDATICIGNAEDTVFADHHLCSGFLVGLDSSWDFFHIGINAIPETSSFS